MTIALSLYSANPDVHQIALRAERSIAQGDFTPLQRAILEGLFPGLPAACYRKEEWGGFAPGAKWVFEFVLTAAPGEPGSLLAFVEGLVFKLRAVGLDPRIE